MNTKTITAATAIRQIQESGKRAASHERVTEIIDAVISPGAHVRQGDIIVTFLEPTDQASKGAEITDRQLAPGNSPGSRHIAEGDVRLFAPSGRDALEGPELRVGDGGCTITHPEHRHYRLPAGSRVRVTYERDLASEERARVED